MPVPWRWLIRSRGLPQQIRFVCLNSTATSNASRYIGEVAVHVVVARIQHVDVKPGAGDIGNVETLVRT